MPLPFSSEASSPLSPSLVPSRSPHQSSAHQAPFNRGHHTRYLAGQHHPPVVSGRTPSTMGVRAHSSRDTAPYGVDEVSDPVAVRVGLCVL